MTRGSRQPLRFAAGCIVEHPYFTIHRSGDQMRQQRVKSNVAHGLPNKQTTPAKTFKTNVSTQPMPRRTIKIQTGWNVCADPTLVQRGVKHENEQRLASSHGTGLQSTRARPLTLALAYICVACQLVQVRSCADVVHVPTNHNH